MSDEAQQPACTTEDPAIVTDAGRTRRPSSLRAAAAVAGSESASASRADTASDSASDTDFASDGDSASASAADGASGTGLRSKLTSASFPRGKLTAASFARGKLTAASFARGKLTAASFPRRGPKTDVGPASTTDPAASVPDAGPSPSQKLITLVSERPEVGLGIAFAAGLVIATILKRLAR